jgi:hypothetical protein
VGQRLSSRIGCARLGSFGERCGGARAHAAARPGSTCGVRAVIGGLIRACVRLCQEQWRES